MPRNDLLDDTRDALVESRSGESIRMGMTLAGAALVALGGYLPWIQHNPDFEGVAIVLSPQLRPGFEGFDLILLVPVGLVLALLLVRGQTKWWTRFTALVGLAAVLLPTFIALDSFLESNPYFVPDLGLPVTVLGGSLLLAVAGYDRYTRD